MSRFAPVEKALAAVEAGTAPTLKLMFSHHVVVDAAGKHLAPHEADGEAHLYVKSTAVQPGQRYLCVALDPDAPFPSFPFLGPVLHGIQTDLVLPPSGSKSASAATDKTGTEDGAGWSLLVSEKPPLVSHAKPGPPSISAPHRYVYVLWPQPGGNAGADAYENNDKMVTLIRAKLGWGDGPIGLTQRMRFDVNFFVAALGLGDIAALTYFTSSS